MKIEVLIVDDHALVREGLVAVLALEPDLQVVAQARDGDEALGLLGSNGPAVVIVDVNLPRMSGIELTRRIVERSPSSAVLILSMHRDKEVVRAAFEAGALGYLAKDSPRAELAAAVRAVASRQRFVGPGIDPGSLGPVLRGEPRAREALSPRETDVLRLVAEGLASKEIADRLGLTTRTVEWYRGQIMGKLGIGSVAGLVKFALRHHLVALDE